MNNEPVAWMCKDDDVITDKFKQSGKGGIHGDENLQLLCPACNLKKSNKDPIVWANQNGRLL